MGVDPLPGLDLFRGMSDGQAVFHDHFADRDIPERHLVALRDVLHRSCTAKGGACGRGMEGNCYIINIVYLYKNGHNYLQIKRLSPAAHCLKQRCRRFTGYPLYRQSAYAFRTPSLRIFSRSAATAASNPSIFVRSSPHICSLVITAWVRVAASSSLWS